jgi:hypothetical protein
VMGIRVHSDLEVMFTGMAFIIRCEECIAWPQWCLSASVQCHVIFVSDWTVFIVFIYLWFVVCGMCDVSC